MNHPLFLNCSRLRGKGTLKYIRLSCMPHRLYLVLYWCSAHQQCFSCGDRCIDEHSLAVSTNIKGVPDISLDNLNFSDTIFLILINYRSRLYFLFVFIFIPIRSLLFSQTQRSILTVVCLLATVPCCTLSVNHAAIRTPLLPSCAVLLRRLRIWLRSCTRD